MEVAELPEAEQRKNRINCDWIQTTEIRVGYTMVIPTDSVTNIGVIVDENLSMHYYYTGYQSNRESS